MSNLLAARSQMALSLGFHIIFAAISIALPLLMVLAEWRWLRTRQAEYLSLAKRMATGSAIIFAVGAVSGTVLSFELGLLWPHFMEWAGGAIGIGFSLEGFAFFTEAIFIGVYLYGWDRIPPAAHLTAGLLVALSGDVIAKHAAQYEPAKLAAFEAHFRTQAGAPFRLLGIPDPENGTVPYSIEIPKGLSLLIYNDPNAVVAGLDQIPRDEWPPVTVVHIAFQIMVGCGMALIGVAVWSGWRWWRYRDLFESRLFLWSVVLV